MKLLILISILFQEKFSRGRNIIKNKTYIINKYIHNNKKYKINKYIHNNKNIK